MKDKKPGSRNSSKSRLSKEVAEPAADTSGDEDKELEPFWPVSS